VGAVSLLPGRLPGLVTDVKLAVIEGGPHAIRFIHADHVNRTQPGLLRAANT
jgi:hypothetical protein